MAVARRYTTPTVIVGALTLALSGAVVAHAGVVNSYCSPYGECTAVAVRDGHVQLELVTPIPGATYTVCVDGPAGHACLDEQLSERHRLFHDHVDVLRAFGQGPGRYTATWTSDGNQLGPSFTFRAPPRTSRDQPLSTNAPDLLSNAVPVRRSFSYGMPIVYNETTSKMTLRSVHLVDETPGMQLVGAYALGPHRYLGHHRINLFSGGDGWPTGIHAPIRPLQPLRGHTVPRRGTPEHGWGTELYLKLRVAHTGRFEFKHLAVRYRVGGKTYRAVIRHPFAACGRGDPDRRCPIHAT